MAKVVYANQYLDAVAAIYSERVLLKILSLMRTLEEAPEIGSKNVPASIKEEFGNTVYKIPVASFDIVYQYHRQQDTVHVLALVPQRMAK